MRLTRRTEHSANYKKFWRPKKFDQAGHGPLAEKTGIRVQVTAIRVR